MGPAIKRRKLNSSSTEEIVFDSTSREDYLTGFHKRKQARIKHAQEIAAKKEREEKIRGRKALRDRRKEELEAHVEAVNATMRNLDDYDDGRGGGEDDGSEDEEGWKGIEDQADELDREDEYVDEDKYTTVTVETVGISRNGFVRPGEDADSEENETLPEEKQDRKRQDEASRMNNIGKQKSENAKTKKMKKKKFRYESKGERKATRLKERSKNRAKAKARRET